MSKKEEQIEAEIRRRAIERASELESKEQQHARREANIEALEMVANLSREELEKIDHEVRSEMQLRNKRKKLLLVIILPGSIILLLFGLYFLLISEKREAKQPARSIPPMTQPIPAKPESKQLVPVKQPTGKIEIQETEKTIVPKQRGPILTKPEAEEILTEPLKECLQESGYYSMIVRVGQGYEAPDSGPLAPLTIVFDKATINYRDIENFTGTPLGKCVIKKISEIQTRASRGNYMHFKIVNDSVSDPLKDAMESIDRKEAKSVLSNFDEEALDCVNRYPEYAQSGRKISISITFRGLDGSVIQVIPFYVEQSPYKTCLEEVYGKARVHPFRKLNEKVVHTLSP
jgi:hypothetical protein